MKVEKMPFLVLKCPGMAIVGYRAILESYGNEEAVIATKHWRAARAHCRVALGGMEECQFLGGHSPAPIGKRLDLWSVNIVPSYVRMNFPG